MAIPPPAPLPHPLWQNFPMCPVTGSSERMAHTARLAFSSRKNLFRARQPGPCQRRRCVNALQMLWEGPGRQAPKNFFLDPSTTRRQHLSAVLIYAKPFWAVYQSTVWNGTLAGLIFADTYVWPLSVEGDLPLKYRSREISSKQYGAGQYQQISDVFLKQGRSCL